MSLPGVTWYVERRTRARAEHDARALLAEARRILRRYAYRITEDVAREVRRAAEELQAALAGADLERLKAGIGALDDQITRHLAWARKSAVREYTESIGAALFLALLLRAFCVEAFKIPSGSMLPTLEVGDHIFVNKFVYGLRVPMMNKKFVHVRMPRRGEVVVFVHRAPGEPADKDFIKRVVAVAGDTVEVRDNRLILNGQPVRRRPLPGACAYDDLDERTGRWEVQACQAFEEEQDGVRYLVVQDAGPADGPGADFGPHVIPPGNVFVMGDNRDNSHDSRFWIGQHDVPLDLVKGKAMFIWFSWGPGGMRWPRLFHGVHSLADLPANHADRIEAP